MTYSARDAIDIAIVNYKTAADTLAGVHALGPWDQGTVWVVDNSEDILEAQTLRQSLADRTWVRVLVAPKNLGFGRACNLAFERSTAPNFLLLNPDASIEGRHVLHLRHALQEHPDCAAIAPNLFWNEEGSFLTPIGSTQSPYETLLERALTHSFRLACAMANWSVIKNRHLLDTAAPLAHVPMISGAVVMLRRSAVVDAGGLFDPDYFMFFEDADLSLRLRRKGWRLAVLPAATAVHSYRHAAHKAELMHASHQTFLSKHHPHFFSVVGDTGRLTRLAARRWPSAWFDLHAPALSSAEAWARQFNGLGVVALSPSWMMKPALFRPQSRALTPLSDSEWQLLEPGHYTVLLSDSASEPEGLTWAGFRKSVGQPDGPLAA